MMKILFVCTGNICRSPTAEAIARHKAHVYQVSDKFIFDSAGINSRHSGKSPDPRAVATGSKYCISFDGIKARQLQQEDFADFDLILTMDHGHYTSAMELCPEEYKNKVHLLLQYCNVENSWDDEVFDPYYRSNSGFDEVFVMIDQAIKNLFEQEREKESF
jgi:protein-tyrosine phosphatase